ncbi:MAG: GNAT family N-acetyltransferase [Proteobacteria bacterium]|nr:GNAT family N-acetyltransferase [Pseudomonadota bacterium]
MIAIRRLRPDDDRTQFRSGNVELDRFFARYAGQNQFRHHIGSTYVAVEEAILGFATMAASEIFAGALPPAVRKQLPAYALPVLRLARLAVDERARGKGIAQLLLQAVFAQAHTMAAEIGCIGVVVDAKPEAVGFYLKLGFESLGVAEGELGDRPQPSPMFLKLGKIPREPR